MGRTCYTSPFQEDDRDPGKMSALCLGLWGCLERRVPPSLSWREFVRKPVCTLHLDDNGNKVFHPKFNFWRSRCALYLTICRAVRLLERKLIASDSSGAALRTAIYHCAPYFVDQAPKYSRHTHTHSQSEGQYYPECTSDNITDIDLFLFHLFIAF